MSKDSSDFDSRFDPAFQRGFDGPVNSRSVEREAEIGYVEVPLDLDVIEPQVQDTGPHRANPFMLGLGVVAVALVAGGLYLVSRMQAVFGDTAGASDFDFVTLQVLMYAAPLLVVLGIATGIGVLFIAAVRWSR